MTAVKLKQGMRHESPEPIPTVEEQKLKGWWDCRRCKKVTARQMREDPRQPGEAVATCGLCGSPEIHWNPPPAQVQSPKSEVRSLEAGPERPKRLWGERGTARNWFKEMHEAVDAAPDILPAEEKSKGGGAG